ncbi:hypothetical protein NP233_g6975 [Leucocoprinus birnbaumii]|uniref:Fungal-type protein kinase domain-containing protein n=1 Tax=Leucocoprinus birnbaumii TaxID=56174 RepID=A0AAD5VTE0_9AGAR|nr:hypothetical protein NP233_g6975 [Leucocoprinus birnbaumii]
MKDWVLRPLEHVEAKEADSDLTKDDRKMIRQTESRIWLQTYTVVQIDMDTRRSKAQLAGFVGEIFAEQFDRHFVPAFSFHLGDFSIHLFDRSGVLSSTPIDIHQAPHLFIAAIASWSCLSPVQLAMERFSCALCVPWVIEGFDVTAHEPDGVADGGHILPVFGMPPTINQISGAPGNSTETCRLRVVQDKKVDQEEKHSRDSERTRNSPRAVTTSLNGMTIGPSSKNNQTEDRETDTGVHRPTLLVSDRPGISKGKRYWVAIRSIKLQDAERVLGRGTIVLEVVSLKDWEEKNSKAKRYVLKQSWQRPPGLENDGATVALSNSSALNSLPEEQEEILMLEQGLLTRPFEAAVLSRARLEERVTEAGFVRVDSKNVDTATYIRKGISLDTSVDTIKPQGKPEKQSRLCTKSRMTTSHTTSSCARETIGLSSLSVPVAGAHQGFVNRTLVRIVFNICGVTIREFANKKELLMGFKGALEEHELCYRHGIIQRDISTGNIMINDGRGHLIDFDHSKITDKLDTLRRESGHQIPQRRRDAWLQEFPADIVDLAEELFQKAERADMYLIAKYYTKLGQVNEPSSFADIGWPEELYNIPIFDSRKAGPGYVTGTPPFMSGWLNSHPDHPHTAVQDTECFLWVFGYLALKYSGPGQIRTMSPELKAFFEGLFSGDNESQEMKLKILIKEEELEKFLSHVSPYFEDLKDLIREWWKVLDLAYRFPAGVEYNYPHQAILCCIQQALDRIDASPNSQSDGELQEKVRQERTTYIKNIQQAILNQKTFDALTNPGTDTATPSTIPIQAAPSSGPTTRSSNPTVPSEQVSRPHKRSKEA